MLPFPCLNRLLKQSLCLTQMLFVLVFVFSIKHFSIFCCSLRSKSITIVSVYNKIPVMFDRTIHFPFFFVFLTFWPWIVVDIFQHIKCGILSLLAIVCRNYLLATFFDALKCFRVCVCSVRVACFLSVTIFSEKVFVIVWCSIEHTLCQQRNGIQREID